MAIRAPLYWIQEERLDQEFPDTTAALAEPNGLLAAGGDLSPERLLSAYRHGIFPWFSDNQPILWWAPDPRSILYPDALKISRSLRKTIRREPFNVTVDRAFGAVIRGCAEPRGGDAGTWVTDTMIEAYETLHEHGYAHSVECWSDDELVGGLYGVSLGCVFFGESMFTRASDASKIAMVHLASRLCEWGYKLVDCQVHNPHLESLGAITIARSEFDTLLARFCMDTPASAAWHKEVVS